MDMSKGIEFFDIIIVAILVGTVGTFMHFIFGNVPIIKIIWDPIEDVSDLTSCARGTGMVEQCITPITTLVLVLIILISFYFHLRIKRRQRC